MRPQAFVIEGPTDHSITRSHANIAPVPLLMCDLDDTLIDRAAAFDSWLRHFGHRHCLSDEDIAALRREDRRGLRPREEFFEAVNQHLSPQIGARILIEDFQSSFASYFPPLDSKTSAALRSLRGDGWKVAVVTNGSPGQLRKMEATGIISEVDAWCVSEVDGVRKPEPAIFRLAAAKCGATLAGAWMVGDSPETDIGGAVAAGINSAWLHRGRAWPLSSFRPDLIVSSVVEAIERIRVWT